MKKHNRSKVVVAEDGDASCKTLLRLLCSECGCGHFRVYQGPGKSAPPVLFIACVDCGSTEIVELN